MGTEQSKDLWAIVFTPGAKYIGTVTGYVDSKEDREKLLLNTSQGLTIHLSPAFEVTVNIITFQTQQGMQMHREVGAMPVIMTLKGAPLHILGANAVQFLSEMKEADQDGYKRLVQNAEKTAIEASAQRAGIKTSTDKDNRG